MKLAKTAETVVGWLAFLAVIATILLFALGDQIARVRALSYSLATLAALLALVVCVVAVRNTKKATAGGMFGAAIIIGIPAAAAGYGFWLPDHPSPPDPPARPVAEAVDDCSPFADYSGAQTFDFTWNSARQFGSASLEGSKKHRTKGSYVTDEKTAEVKVFLPGQMTTFHLIKIPGDDLCVLSVSGMDGVDLRSAWYGHTGED